MSAGQLKVGLEALIHQGILERLMTTNVAMVTLREHCIPYKGTFAFIMSPDNRLQGLMPLEVLSGMRLPDQHTNGAQRRLMALPIDERKRHVFKCLD